eukprot:TRINITY_DN28926_c0_g1_i1.p1 TRINITY_DN28926_c0_g1~~TRINITY_DN28926_c0_g1_i1.p1  ORF type:complete len:384 (+),score=113.69 TRINITY_DN28926_c0_g1_i1:13-1164(+)
MSKLKRPSSTRQQDHDDDESQPPPSLKKRRLQDASAADSEDDDDVVDANESMFQTGAGDEDDDDEFDYGIEVASAVGERGAGADDDRQLKKKQGDGGGVNWADKVKEAEEDDDVVDRGHKARAGIGQKPDDVPIMPFNLKNERRGGAFDAEGFYVRRSVSKRQRRRLGDADDDEDDEADNGAPTDDEEEDERDQWLDQWDEHKKQPKHKDKRDLFLGAGSSKQTSASDRASVRIRTTALDNLLVLHHLLQRGESVLEAVRRTKNEKEAMLLITECADDLLSEHGVIQVYELTWEEINRLKAKEDAKHVALQWEYKVSPENEDGGTGAQVVQVFGPYSSSEMQEWKNSGYFGEDNPAYVRMRKSQDGALLTTQWLPSTSISNFL